MVAYIYKAAVIGAGQMGSGIAQVFSFAGIPCVMRDSSKEALDRGMQNIRGVYDGRVKKGKMTPEEAASKAALVTPSMNDEDLKDVDIVVEAVFEDLKVKRDVFKWLAEKTPAHAILASNTSSLPISAIAAASGRADKVVGLHFFFPASVMKLVEIVPALQTSTDVVDSVVSLCESLRKIPVKVKETPGFLVNRVLLPYLYEAVRVVHERAATPVEVDNALVAFGMPMGPFLLVDNVGVDICYHVAHVMRDGLGARAEIPELLELLYKEKRFGRKTGAGIFRYDGKDEDFDKVLAKASPLRKTTFTVERILYSMLNETCQCLEENVASPSDVDLALLAGIGWPQSTGGILRWADDVGLDNIYQQLRAYASDLGPRFHPSVHLKRLIDAGFYGKKSGRGFFEYT